jgi:hypothetical protein
MDTQLEKVEGCLGKAKAMNMEARPGEIEFEVEREEIPMEEATVETFGALKEQYKDGHLAVIRRDQLKKWTQGNWWVPEEVGHHLQRDDMPCRSDTAIRDKARTVLYKEPGKDNVWEEASGTVRMEQWYKVPRPKE